MGDLTNARWRKATRCGGNTGDQSGESEESCVLVAAVDVKV
jgi:hypothetical protein